MLFVVYVLGMVLAAEFFTYIAEMQQADFAEMARWQRVVLFLAFIWAWPGVALAILGLALLRQRPLSHPAAQSDEGSTPTEKSE